METSPPAQGHGVKRLVAWCRPPKPKPSLRRLPTTPRPPFASPRSIFKGAITEWDDPAITKDNPGLGVPKGSKINVVRRQDGSSSTWGLTTYLADACPDGWAEPGAPVWPEGSAPGAAAVQGSMGVVKAVTDVPYSIG
jgi:phosphate transport system substrate-binding protein